MNKKLKIITPEFVGYEKILLKLYFEIANTGNYSLLQVRGNTDIEKCIEVWEDIVKKNDEASGGTRYIKLFKQHKRYAKLYHEYLYIKTALCYLWAKPDDNIIKELKIKGYKIDKSSLRAYDESIIACFNKSNSILTKIISQENEIKSSIPQSKKTSFEELMAQLTAKLGFVVDDDVTLARYNEYWKIIKLKDQPNTPTKNERRIRSK